MKYTKIILLERLRRKKQCESVNQKLTRKFKGKIAKLISIRTTPKQRERRKKKKF